MEAEKEAGISLYDIEFKDDRGEIEVAEDGTVMDVAVVIAAEDLPAAAAEAIRKAAPGATITQVEKSEVRAEIKKDGKGGKVVKYPASRYVFEAELTRGEERGEIEVAADGHVVHALKWGVEEE